MCLAFRVLIALMLFLVASSVLGLFTSVTFYFLILISD